MQKHQAFWMVSWALLAAHANAIPASAEAQQTPMVQCRAWAHSEAEAAYPSAPSDQDIKDLTLTLNSPRKPDPKKQQEMENQLTATCVMQQMAPGNRVSIPKPRTQTPLCHSGEYWSSSIERCQKVGE